MSYFQIKIIATIIMLLDHAAIILEAWGVIPHSMYTVMRGFGRIAFPLYAFLLVNGYQYTKDIAKYARRLWVFAILSQIPYTLALHTVNLMNIGSNQAPVHISYNGIVLFDILLALWYFDVFRNIRSAIIVFLGMFLSGFSIRINEIWILYSGELNIFYLLALGLLIIISYEKISKKEISSVPHCAFILISALISIIYTTTRTGYGVAGYILILGIFLLRKHRHWQCAYMSAWGYVFYAFILDNHYNALFACLSGLVVFLYNERKGTTLKYFFYYFYPAHLLLLGLYNVFNKV